MLHPGMTFYPAPALPKTDTQIRGKALAEQDRPQSQRSHEAIARYACRPLYDLLNTAGVADPEFAIGRGRFRTSTEGPPPQHRLGARHAEYPKAQENADRQCQRLNELQAVGSI